MKTFKSLEEVEVAGLSPPVHAVVHNVVKNLIKDYAEYGRAYDAEEDGYTVLIAAGDTDADVESEVGYTLREAILEGGWRCLLARDNGKPQLSRLPGANEILEQRG